MPHRCIGSARQREADMSTDIVFRCDTASCTGTYISEADGCSQTVASAWADARLSGWQWCEEDGDRCPACAKSMIDDPHDSVAVVAYPDTGYEFLQQLAKNVGGLIKIYNCTFELRLGEKVIYYTPWENCSGKWPLEVFESLPADEAALLREYMD